MKKYIYLCISLFLFFSPPALLIAQDRAAERVEAGIDLFSQGRWQEAVLELRRGQAEATSNELRGEALYWISISLINAGEFEEALRDMHFLEQISPNNYRVRELDYHRGRSLYFLNYHEEAIYSLASYMNSLLPGPSGYLSIHDSARRAAALYWIGESLLSMGQLDSAEDVFSQIVTEYPWSSKYEASYYRLALIDHRRIEVELLNLLSWSHEEALRNLEEFQRREAFYDQALSAYQRRVAALTGTSEMRYDRLSELENENVQFREQLAAAEDRVRYLETFIRDNINADGRVSGLNPAERLQLLRISAEEIERHIQRGQ